MTDSTICLRQGYHCVCEQCQIWIRRWEKELECFSVVEKLINEGKSLFQIYERIRAEYPDQLRLYHITIEDLYFKSKRSNLPSNRQVEDDSPKRKRIRLKNKSTSTASPPSPLSTPALTDT